MVKVSILCLTYNQEKYIKQTLDGMLMQETDFDFEILINDDASTDSTTEIIKQYAENYPKIIKPNIQKENLYSQGIRNMIVRFLLPKARGKYLALCEGDDYWTDSHKLQKQVDFLDKNRDYALCFHPVKVFFENKEKEDYIFPSEKDSSKFTTKKLLKRNFIQTNSVMYRKQKYKNMPLDVMPGDWYLHVYHATFGKIGFIDETMSVYRRHQDSMWWNSKNDRYKIWAKHGIEHLNLFLEFLKLAGDKKENIEEVEKSMGELINNLIETDINHKTELLNQVTEKYPNLISKFMTSQYRSFLQLKNTINKKDLEIKELNRKLYEKQQAIIRRDETTVHLNKRLAEIQTSLSYRTLSRLRKMLPKKGKSKK